MPINAFQRGFIEEMEKIAVTQKWVREKLHPKGEGEFKFLRGQPFVTHYMKEKLRPYLKAQGVYTEEEANIAKKHLETLQQQMVSPEGEYRGPAGYHVPRRGRTYSTTGTAFGLPPREVFHHEMAHRLSPVAPSSETVAGLYGALKARLPLREKIKHTLRRVGSGLKQDIDPIREKFLDPLKRALV